MADETTTPVAETPVAIATETTTATPPAGALTTETLAEVMIPKSRFDEVNNRLKSLEQESTKAAKAAKEAEAKRLEEEGKFKELYEKQQAELSAAQQAAKEKDVALMQIRAADKAKFPAAIASLLQGESEEDMVTHARNILAAMPRAEAPNINAQSGAGGAPQAGQMSDADKKELAARLNVDARYIQ